MRLKSLFATTQRRRRHAAPQSSRSELAWLFAGGALTFVVGLLAATLHLERSVGSSVTQPLNGVTPSAQLGALPVARAQSSATAPLQPPSIVNVNDLPVERSVNDGARPGASQRRLAHGLSAQSVEAPIRVPK